MPSASPELALLNFVQHVVLLSDSAAFEAGHSLLSVALALDGARTQPESQNKKKTLNTQART